jgi:hypothetical protein
MSSKPAPRLLTTDEVAAAAGVTYRQLDYWCRAGYLSPALASGRMRGHAGKARRWSSHEALVAACMGQLTRAGIAPGVAAPIARRVNGASRRLVGTLAEGIMIVLDVPVVPGG